MAQGKRKQPPSADRLPPQLGAVNLHAAGIDVGAFEHGVAAPQGADPQLARRFGGCTADREALADWLAACGVRTVAMESTGVFWVPLFELLGSRGFAVRLVDARPVHQVAGRPKGELTTASGCNGRTPPACWPAPSGPPSRSACCAATCGSGPC